MKKTLDFSVLSLLYDFLYLKNGVNVPSKRNKHKKASDEKSRIRIPSSKVGIRNFGYVPKRHGSGTLVDNRFFMEQT
jgi:hypothetical protein